MSDNTNEKQELLAELNKAIKKRDERAKAFVSLLGKISCYVVLFIIGSSICLSVLSFFKK